MGKRLTATLGFLLIVAICLALGACTVFDQPRFGKLPQGGRLDRIQGSSNYRDGKFQNRIPTPKFSTDVGLASVIWSGFFDKNDRLIPDSLVPVVKTDLKALNPETDAVVWLGHSSWFVQIGGKRILIDPVFSDHAAPFSFMNRAFDGTTIYAAGDMPEIDCLLISHDHWDHLDYSTVLTLRSKVKQVICPLGVGTYFEYWDYPVDTIREGDWWEEIALGKDFSVHVLPARHYSGRLFKENKTLWAGFAIQTPKLRIFFSGDSGYGPHFSEIGDVFRGFDLVLLDCGQYDPRWSYIHMTPEEAARAAQDLGARALIPAHVGRFTIANHPWDEPFKRLTEACQNQSYRLLTPEIGEPVMPDENPSPFFSWWRLKGGTP
ncbi:MBL fold metallo-hydrolase [Desulfosarcina widdelii]|uniref:MBL fold metallo-hydrolase n=1 Tax=Desulfosarcina widdelii TaxID=947919 RepID=A0A5K7Z0K8_9BACT|nr:MBL fold metallo-hydrolase [Desulfosarcina widdelii]BBO74225.1 MBL fold metallo-hydrolase [Desulfosarcina widdelii]